MYANAVEVKKFNDKVDKAMKEGKTIRTTQPKEGKVPEEYMDLMPLQDAALKKSILPSMPINLFEIGKKYSKILTGYVEVPQVMSPNGHATRLIDGERLKRLDELPTDSFSKDIYVATTCFVIKAEEFAYAKGAKRALKVILDCDGITLSEKVLWPNYETGQLVYDPGVKRGTICTVFFRKKVGKKEMSIVDIVLEGG
jgi:hypothetical protein